MKKMKKKLTLIEMVTSIVVLIISLLGIVIYISISNSVVTMIESSQEQNINREIETIKKELLSYINFIEIILNDNASVPIITQAVMQPEDSLANLKDFLDDLKILNERFNLSVLDYNGKLLYSNNIVSTKDYSNEVWVEHIMQDNYPSYKSVSKINSSYYWTIAVPIIYNANAEGILVAEIPINKVYNYKNTSEHLQGIQIEILKESQIVLLLGEVEDGWERYDSLPDLGVNLKFVLDQGASEEMFKELKITLLIIIVSFIFIAVVTLIIISKKFIIKPITDLKYMIDEFMVKDIIDSNISEVAVVEINDLSKQYVDMSKIIVQRENALKVSEKMQIDKNIKLENLLEQLESTQSLIIQQEKLASIGRLAAGVAHELNSPIGFVSSNFDVLKDYLPILIAYVEFLKTGKNIDETDFEDIEYILDDIPTLIKESEEGFIRIIDIVRNLKDYSRIDISKTEKYNLNKGLETTLMVSRNEYKYIAKINTEFDKLPDIIANGSEINEVLLNLIVNAAQALSDFDSEYEKMINIKTYIEEPYVCCEIYDNGPGIEDTVINKIFDPFFTTKEPGKGTGLGLNIAYNIIKNNHDGELQVHSKLGEGAKFVIKLPIDVKE